jgi:hypothetical protein
LDYKGLPEFAQLVKGLLDDVLHLGPEVQTDIFYLNKTGSIICGFEPTQDGGFIKQEFEIAQKKSLLKMAVHDNFIPGKTLGPSKFSNILSHRNLNSKCDLPLTEHKQRLAQDPHGLH